MNNGFCKPVENSVVLILHDSHYYSIKARGTEVPMIDPGKMILCEESRRATFNPAEVNALNMDEDDNDNASDKDSESNDIEKMPQKKI